MKDFFDGFLKPFQTQEEQLQNKGDPVVSYGVLALILLATR